MAFAQDSIRSDGASGTQLAALSDALVKLHKETCGRGPTNARCYMSGNSVVCLLFGGLTPAERTLLAHGQLDTVVKQRAALHDVMRDRARELVEELLGRRVTAMTMAADPANELETAVFVLDAPSSEC
jgi:uncharacterized protein YbcI